MVLGFSNAGIALFNQFCSLSAEARQRVPTARNRKCSWATGGTYNQLRSALVTYTAFRMQLLKTDDANACFNRRKQERKRRMQLCAVLMVAVSLVLAGCATSGHGEGVAYHDLDAENQEKKEPRYRTTGVDLEWREAASGKFNLGWTRPGEWLIYTVDVKEAGTYRIDMHVACKGPGGRFYLEFDGMDRGVNRTGPITVPDTGGWEHLKPFSHEGVKLAAGRQVMKVVMDTGGTSGSIGDIDYFKFVKQ